MAADIRIQRVTGSSGSQSLTNVTTTTNRLNTADAPLDGTSNPIAIPTSGSRYSYWGSYRLFCITAPTTAVNSVKLYSDGTNSMGTGVDLVVSTRTGTNGDTTTGYTQATGTPGTTGTVLNTTNYPGISTPVSVFTYTVSSPLPITGTFTTGVDTPSSTPTGAFGDWIILQTTVGTSAAAGVTPAETLTIIYDEW